MSNPAAIAQASLEDHYLYHGDVYVAANLPVLLDADTTRVPYLLVAIGTLPDAREQWNIPDEGTPEIVVIEASAVADKPLWEKVGVRELFVIDQEAKTVSGFWLSPRGLVAMSPEEGSGRVASAELHLELAFTVVDGQPMLRFFKKNGVVIQTAAEIESARRKRIAKLIDTHTDELEEEIADHEATLKP